MKIIAKMTSWLGIVMILATGICSGAYSDSATNKHEHKEVKASHFERLHKGAPIALGQQSPVMIDTKDTTKVVEANLRDIIFAYTSKNFAVTNTGHSTQLKSLDVRTEGKPDYIIVDEVPYYLAQFHFHTPSEHTVDGKEPYPMEVHFVHVRETRGDDGATVVHYAVIGVFIEIGDRNPEFEKIISKIPKTPDRDVAVPLGQELDLMKLFPKNHLFFRYSGSLTTPPYTPGVLWMVMKNPIQLSQDQVDRIQKIMGSNARALQELNVPIVSDTAVDKAAIVQPGSPDFQDIVGDVS